VPSYVLKGLRAPRIEFDILASITSVDGRQEVSISIFTCDEYSEAVGGYGTSFDPKVIVRKSVLKFEINQ
jgi:hypothetical protein